MKRRLSTLVLALLLCVALLPLPVQVVQAESTPTAKLIDVGGGVFRVEASGLRLNERYMVRFDRGIHSPLAINYETDATGSFITEAHNVLPASHVTFAVIPIGMGGVTVENPDPPIIQTMNQSVSLDVPSFADEIEGYSTVPYGLVVITNTGDIATGGLTVEVEGPFVTVPAAPFDQPSIDFGSNASFDIRPEDNLAVGVHEGTVTVRGGPSLTAVTATVRFEVLEEDDEIIDGVRQGRPPAGSAIDDPGSNSPARDRDRPTTEQRPVVTPQPCPDCGLTPCECPPEDCRICGRTPCICAPDVTRRCASCGDVNVLCGCAMFDDVHHTDWFCEYVGFVASHGLFRGTAPGIFSPQTSMTRAMFVQVLANMEGVNLAWLDSSNKFVDVADGAWYQGAVAWAYNEGITRGVGADIFAPSRPITREEMTVLLHRYAEHRNVTLPRTVVAEFPDQGRVSSWASESVSVIQAAGIVRGRDDGSFDPQATATRAEVAAIFRRFMAEVRLAGCVHCRDGVTSGTPVAPQPPIVFDDFVDYGNDFIDDNFVDHGDDFYNDVDTHQHHHDHGCDDDDCDDCEDDHVAPVVPDTTETASVSPSGRVARFVYGTDWGSLLVSHDFTDGDYTISFAFMHSEPELFVYPNRDPWFFTNPIAVASPANQWGSLTATFSGSEVGDSGAIAIASEHPRTVGSVLYIDNVVITNAAGTVVVNLDFESDTEGLSIPDWSNGTVTSVPMP
jgi:hypothetical protein